MTIGEEPAFCPACGQAVVERVLEEDHRPRLLCPNGHITWRNPRLVVGTLPVREGRVFLARRSIEPGLGRWTYPGGYLEVGEAAQEGARRETEERHDRDVARSSRVPHGGIQHGHHEDRGGEIRQ